MPEPTAATGMPSWRERITNAVRDPLAASHRVATRARLARLALVNRLSRRSVLGDADVTVNVTSYGHRIPKLFYAIESIGRGKTRPARFILWLDDEATLADPPAELERLRRRGLEILPSTDYGPHKKQYPYSCSIDRHQRPLVVADDDTLYPTWWLTGLVEAHQHDPANLHGYRAHRMATTESAIAPYGEWTPAVSGVTSFATFCTGVGGMILPPVLLDALRYAGEAFLQAAPRNDDIWVHAMAVRSGVRCNQIGDRDREFTAIPGTQLGSLYRTNVREGGNDVQIAATYAPADVERIIADERRQA